MKILCPIDFSQVSVKAAEWVSQFLNDLGGGQVTFLHCMETQHRANMFNEMDDLLKENAMLDMQHLVDRMQKLGPEVEFNIHIARAEPKEYIVSYARHKHYDWIVTGTKGLTALKDVTVGSVTEYCIMKSAKPVLTIPEHAEYKKIESIVIGVDNKLIQNQDVLKPVYSICNVFDARIKLVHIKVEKESTLNKDPGYAEYFRDLNYEIESIEKDGTISHTLSKYADDNNADILVMIHHRKNWFQEMFKRSVTKMELFEVEKPLFILSD